MNPIVEQQQHDRKERDAQEAFRYPFRIICVYENAKNSDFPIIHDVRNFCSQNHLTFLSRQYDVDKYKEDMFIERLPAFHVYVKTFVQETHYYDLDPVYKIQLFLWAFQDEERAKERAKIRRQERWNEFVEMFSLERFKRRPALDLDRSLSHVRDLSMNLAKVPHHPTIHEDC